MKTFFRWVVRILVTLVCLVILLAVLAVLLKDVIAKSFAEKSLRDSTGMDAKITKLEIGLATPTITLEGLKLYNTTNFGGGTFLEMPELRLEYTPGDFRKGKLHFATVRLSLSEVNIIKNKNGKTNIDVLDKEVKKQARDKEKSGQSDVFGGIDTLYLSVGKVRMSDEGDPRNNEEINLNLKDEVGKNLKTEAELTQWFNAVILKAALRDAMSGSKASAERWQKLLKFFGVRL